jgi:low affinity Fe/Cu permease
MDAQADDLDGNVLERLGDLFGRAARGASHSFGTPWAFFVACGIVVVWALTGPALGFSTTWQLVINTGTTIVTFLMVFLIQNTQNRDSQALHLKIDELLRATAEARTDYVDLEDLPEPQLRRLHERFKALSEHFAQEHNEAHEQIEGEGEATAAASANGRHTSAGRPAR